MEVPIETIISIVVLLVGIAMGYIVGDNRYKRFKTLFNSFTNVMSKMNEAMKDDKITEEEAQAVWDAVYQMYKDILAKEATK
jgi:hypothetical protein